MREGRKSILIQSPTGSGKTILVAHMVKISEKKGMSSFFIVHRRELIKQSIKAFNSVGVSHGVIANGFKEDRTKLIQIASVQTLKNRLNKFNTPSLIISDECHHSTSKTWSRIYEAYSNAYHIGLTATPQRLDGTGLKRWFNVMVNGPSVRWLIDNKYLSDYKIYAPSNINLQNVHTKMGDYIIPELSEVIDKPNITGDVIKHYKKICYGKKAVIFCVSIKHSQHVVEQFNNAGIIAVHVDGKTNKDKRDSIIDDFSKGKITILSNVDLFGEGFDLPSLEVAILLRPTKSLSLYLQQVGRAFRINPDKEYCIILDHAGNCKRFGLPDDERIWTLEGNKGNKKKQEVNIKTCPKCFAVQIVGKKQCLSCDYVFEVASREVEHEDGELVEIDPKEFKKVKLQEQSKCKTFQDLVELGESRGYKRPYLWAKYIFNYRQKKKING